MKHEQDNPETSERQVKKEEFLKLILDQFEDCSYVMLAAIRSFRKSFNIPRDSDK